MLGRGKYTVQPGATARQTPGSFITQVDPADRQDVSVQVQVRT